MWIFFFFFSFFYFMVYCPLNSQESHWCYPNCVQLDRALTLPKMCIGPRTYDPGATFRGNIHRAICRYPKYRERAILAETGKNFVTVFVAIPLTFFFPAINHKSCLASQMNTTWKIVHVPRKKVTVTTATKLASFVLVGTLKPFMH